jgi:hypothetical protein
MRNVLIAAAALVAFAGSANAAKVKMPNGQTRHTWYQLSGRSATCEVSAQTPEAFQLALAGVAGHLAGVTAETIGPDDVSKDAYGDVQVRVRGTHDGQPVHWDFYTSKGSCDLTAKTMKPDQAPHEDIN